MQVGEATPRQQEYFKGRKALLMAIVAFNIIDLPIRLAHGDKYGMPGIAAPGTYRFIIAPRKMLPVAFFNASSINVPCLFHKYLL